MPTFLIIAISLVIATAVPLIVLYSIKQQDLYGTGSFDVIITSFVWGLIAFGLSFVVNTFSLDVIPSGLIADLSPEEMMVRFSAPIVEEILKGIILLYLVRRANFTLFLDGAIYGFAAGIGFAVTENYCYLFGGCFNADISIALAIAVSRVISTNLVHASASSIVGISVGLARFEKGAQRFLIPLGGWLLAIALHVGFNNMVNTPQFADFILVYAAIVGLAGTGVIFLAMKRGLAETKQWVNDSIDEVDRMTAGEAELAKNITSLSELLEPVKVKFGEEKAKQSEKMIRLQARLAIYEEVLAKLPDEKQQERTEKQIEEVHAEMEALRKQIGAYCMLFIRNIFPENVPALWGALDRRIEESATRRKEAGGTVSNVWADLGKQTTLRQKPDIDSEEG